MKHTVLFFSLFILSLGLLQAQDSFEGDLQAHVKALTAPTMEGRKTGTPGERKAALYIAQQFKKMGVEWLYPGNGFQDFSFVEAATGDTLYSQNVVALIPGYDPKLREEYIVIGAHYDHLGSYTMSVNGQPTVCTYPGADSNAGGVAALLCLAQAAQQRHFMYKRSLLFVAFGAEECGAMGSWYFVHRAFGTHHVKLMLNLDRMGRSSLDNKPMAFTGVPHYELELLLRQTAQQPFMPPVEVYGSDFLASDHQAFMQEGVGVCLFTTGTHPYHFTVKDTPQGLDYAQTDAFCQYIATVIDSAANGPEELFAVSARAAAPAAEAKEEPVYAYSEVDKAPMFHNGDLTSFANRWIYTYLKYPQEAVEQGIKGRVMVSFIIEKDGALTHATIERSVDPLLDDEALRVITVSPKWKPGVKNGEKVRVKIVMPVYFELAKRK